MNQFEFLGLCFALFVIVYVSWNISALIHRQMEAFLSDVKNQCNEQPSHPVAVPAAQVKTGETFISKYVRKAATRQPIGLLVAYRGLSGNDIRVGWSKCTLRREGKVVDRFNKRDAYDIAKWRAFNAEHSIDPRFLQQNSDVPYAIRKALPEFVERAAKYFRVNADEVLVCTKTMASVAQ